ncbi:MAG: YhcG family protein [Cyanobacteria bacterium REEB446]|nr:YhcG family protein [Cyanobacteria bacterium REEB446]
MTGLLEDKVLFSDLKKIIDSSRENVARTINSEITLLYWKIGERINTEILQEKRAEYGQFIIKEIAQRLTLEYGNSFSEKNLRRMIQFSSIFPNFTIVSTLSRQLSWSHFTKLISIKESLKRDFYIEICQIEGWSVRQLKERIDSMLYERTAISKKPEKTIENDIRALKSEANLSADLVFRDPYFLDFLGLQNTYSEKDLESAIIAELQRFISELGSDFAFLARQKRISIDSRDYYIDLLFYHRRLKSLVVIDLKLGEFEAAYKGQMELYLRYLEKYEMLEGENSPIGLILCAGKNEEHIELLQLDQTNIKVAEYITQLPEKKLLQEKLHKSLELARNKFLIAELDKEGN